MTEREIDDIIKENKYTLRGFVNIETVKENIENLNLYNLYTFCSRYWENSNVVPLTALLLKTFPNFIDEVKELFIIVVEDALNRTFNRTIEELNPMILDRNMSYTYNIIEAYVFNTLTVTDTFVRGYYSQIFKTLFRWLVNNDFINYEDFEELVQKIFDDLVDSGKATYYNSDEIEEILPIIFDNKDYVIKEGKYNFIFNSDNTLKRFSTLQEAQDYVKENNIQDAYIMR